MRYESCLCCRQCPSNLPEHQSIHLATIQNIITFFKNQTNYLKLYVYLCKAALKQSTQTALYKGGWLDLTLATIQNTLEMPWPPPRKP